jgi:hypothetical protein
MRQKHQIPPPSLRPKGGKRGGPRIEKKFSGEERSDGQETLPLPFLNRNLFFYLKNKFLFGKRHAKVEQALFVSANQT